MYIYRTRIAEKIQMSTNKHNLCIHSISLNNTVNNNIQKFHQVAHTPYTHLESLSKILHIFTIYEYLSLHHQKHVNALAPFFFSTRILSFNHKGH